MTELAARIGPYGAWTGMFEVLPTAQGREAARSIEAMGYGAIWIPEALGREALSSSATYLAATERITIATGIASIWARDPMTAAAGHKTISEAFPDRFLFGLGVSHAPVVEGLRHRSYDRPLTAMREYLDGMDSAVYMAPQPADAHRVLAALRPGMLALARDRADGAHPYLVIVDHTAEARAVLGPDKLLAPEQAVALTADPGEARALGRAHLGIYLGLPNYNGMWKRWGFTDDDLANGGSDRLVDALVAWGSPDDVAKRLEAHRDAGADHVAVQLLGSSVDAVLEGYGTLASALGLSR